MKHIKDFTPTQPEIDWVNGLINNKLKEMHDIEYSSGADPWILGFDSSGSALVLNRPSFTAFNLGFCHNYPRSKFLRYDIAGKREDGFLGYYGQVRMYKVKMWENLEKQFDQWSFTKYLYGHSSKGMWWFRLFGYGIHAKDTSIHDLSFSERCGHRKRLVLGNWSFRFLVREGLN